MRDLELIKPTSLEIETVNKTFRMIAGFIEDILTNRTRSKKPYAEVVTSMGMNINW